MKFAYLVRPIDMKPGAWQVLYYLSEPVTYGDDGAKTQFVIVSAIDHAVYGVETYIFPANAEGAILDWCELDGSMHDVYDHAAVLKQAGYVLETAGYDQEPNWGPSPSLPAPTE
jgi:hypothetical protein